MKIFMSAGYFFRCVNPRITKENGEKFYVLIKRNIF